MPVIKRVIVAATPGQAEAVARTLGLKPNEVLRARVEKDLEGRSVEEIVVATPVKEAGRSFGAVLAVLRGIEERDGKEAERIAT